MEEREMKKSIIAALFCVAMLTAFTGCASSSSTKGSGIKGKSATVSTGKATIVDYQGAAFGSEIPQWVILISEGQYSASTLAKVMPEMKDKKAFVTISQGDNLEFVKQWTDLVDIEVQVGDTMQRIVGKAVSAQETAKAKETGKEKDPTEVERELQMYKEAVSAVEVNGLEKVASYWVEKKVGEKKDAQDIFEYYAVWAMDQKAYESQLDAAMKNVKDNTSEGESLKKTLKEKLTGLVVSSNNPAAEDDAQ
jgi:hypothetical protein